MTSDSSAALLESIESRQCNVGVIGLGYVGLPLIDAFTNAGFRCTGFDVDPEKVQTLLSGKSYIQHIADEKIAAWLSKDRFDATDQMDRLGEPDILLICVPTPLDSARDPDLKYVTSTCESIAKSLRKGQLVVLESTTYPTTTRDVMVPILEKSGLKAGVDFFVAYSPEREDPGNPDFRLRESRKLSARSIRPASNLRVDCTSLPWQASSRSAVAKLPKRQKCSRTFIGR